MDADVAPNVKSLLERLNRPNNTSRQPHHGDELDEAPEYRAFANGRVGNRAQLTLIFCKADGSVKAFSYMHLFCVTADNPQVDFQVEFSGQRIRIQGQNLEPLFHLVCQHKASEIVEARQSQVLTSHPQAPIVEKIDFIDALR